MEIQEIPITDVWPLDRIDKSVAQAYKSLMDRGVIRLRKPIRVARLSGLVIFDYLSTMDKENTHAELKRLTKGE